MWAKRQHTTGFDLVGETALDGVAALGAVGVLALAGCGGGGAAGAAGEGEDAPSPTFGGALAKNAAIPGPEAGFLASFFGVDMLFFWRACFFRLLQWTVGAATEAQTTRLFKKWVKPHQIHSLKVPHLLYWERPSVWRTS